MSVREFIDKVKKKHNIATDKDFFLIVLVFSLAGSMVSILRRPIFISLHLDHDPLWLKIIFSILLIIPLYQISTLVLGFIFGKFHFFWGRQKALGRTLKRVFVREI